MSFFRVQPCSAWATQKKRHQKYLCLQMLLICDLNYFFISIRKGYIKLEKVVNTLNYEELRPYSTMTSNLKSLIKCAHSLPAPSAVGQALLADGERWVSFGNTHPKSLQKICLLLKYCHTPFRADGATHRSYLQRVIVLSLIGWDYDSHTASTRSQTNWTQLSPQGFPQFTI